MKVEVYIAPSLLMLPLPSLEPGQKLIIKRLFIICSPFILIFAKSLIDNDVNCDVS